MMTDRSTGRLCLATALLGTILLTACGGGSSDGGGGGGGGGGGDGGSGGGGGGGGGGGTQSYTVGGTVSGLAGSGLVLQDNGGDDLTVTGSAPFNFATSVANGAKYTVTIKTQPSNPSQTCVLANAGGTISGGNVTDISLACTTNTYSVGGIVTGLMGSGLVLQDNGGDDLAISGNGSFVFATRVASGSAFSVTVKTAPTGPTQVCALTEASGKIESAIVNTITVNCGPIALLAGGLGGYGWSNGTGSDARFSYPTGIASDAAGNLYVADSESETIRKITPAGVVSALAGTANQTGYVDGIGSAARFRYPSGIATDTAGNVYIADAESDTIRKITATGVVTTIAGTDKNPGSSDGTGSAAQFANPNGIAVDAAGNAYIADTDNNTIRKITSAGVVSTLAGTAGQTGSTDGSVISGLSTATFNSPNDIAVDKSGNLYVADSGNNTIRKITPAGVVSTLAGTAGQTGTIDGTGNAARFNYPLGLTVDASGNVYVADNHNFTIRRITPAGDVSTIAGTAGSFGNVDANGTAAYFSRPSDVVVDAAGNAFVADSGNNEIRKITANGQVSTLAGRAAQSGSQDGSGSAARFYSPLGLAADPQGNVYVADYINQEIRKITPAGMVSTLAGGGAGLSGSADGTGATARFNYPEGVAADRNGNVYVADTRNETIRKITPAGVVTTVAGSVGLQGTTDGIGAAARFSDPRTLAADAAGNLYVADTLNCAVRKIAPAGAVTTIAGTPGMCGYLDGPASTAKFSHVVAIAVDTTGIVYLTDSQNVIRKITPDGMVSTLAGAKGQPGDADGSGDTARFGDMYGLAVDSAGNVYAADSSSSTIRRITPAGVVTTVVGTPGSSGDQLGPLPGSINGPYSLAVLPGAGVTLVESDHEDAVLQIALPSNP